jgi:hypothetical protein
VGRASPSSPVGKTGMAGTKPGHDEERFISGFDSSDS